MKTIEILNCDRLPPKDDLNAILAQYYANIIRRMQDMGFGIDPAAPQTALAEFWTHAEDYLPPNGCLVVARNEACQIVGCGMMKRLDRDTGELKRVFVTEAARGTGTGRGRRASCRARACGGAGHRSHARPSPRREAERRSRRR